MSDELDAQRGRLAQEVIDNPAYADAHALIEQEIIVLWRECKDTNDREQLHMLLGLHGQLKAALESVMRSGQVAQAELTRKQTQAEKMALYAVRR